MKVIELKRPKKNKENELAERFLRAMINTGITPKAVQRASYSV